MTLAILVYLVALLGPLADSLSVVIGVGIGVSVLFAIVTAIHVFDSPGSYYREATDAEQVKWNNRKNVAIKYLKMSLIAVCCVSLFKVLLPKEKTAYVMLGAYATQKVAEDPRTQEIGGKVLKMINSKLDSYVDEMTDKVTK